MKNDECRMLEGFASVKQDENRRGPAYGLRLKASGRPSLTFAKFGVSLAIRIGVDDVLRTVQLDRLVLKPGLPAADGLRDLSLAYA